MDWPWQERGGGVFEGAGFDTLTHTMIAIVKRIFPNKEEVSELLGYNLKIFVIPEAAHLAKLHPKDVLRTSPKGILWTSPYGPLCNAKGCPMPTSFGG